MSESTVEGMAPLEPSVLEPLDASGRKQWVGRDLLQKKGGLVGLGILVVIVLFVVVGPMVYHTDQVSTNLTQSNLRPSGAHLLGTDPVGYDVLGRLMYGGRTSLEVGIGAAALATLVGATWGLVAGFVGGKVDAVMMRVVDAMLALPGLLVLIFIAALYPPSVLSIILILAAFAWLLPARLLRGETLTLKVREYVEAARMMGARRTRVMARHILPNTTGIIVVNVTFAVADAILALAGLSFLGLGLQAPTTDWGGMLSDGVSYINAGRWWLIYPAGLAIVLVVVALNLVGEALREALSGR